MTPDRTFETWNPIIGCTHASAGCDHCYARAIALKLQQQGVKLYTDGFRPRTVPSRLDLPFKWRRPRSVFVNSMSDVFHPDIPLSYVKRIFHVIEQCPQHVFQILTKRSSRLASLAHDLPWPDNLMIGVTIESNAVRNRLDDLKQVPARYRILSLEPLLERLAPLDLKGISWVITGGESGPRARPLNPDWVRDIRDWCAASGVPFWFKQHSEYGGRRPPALLDGRFYHEKPNIRITEPNLFNF